jgi:exodeoxyribonuclease VII large subunit
LERLTRETHRQLTNKDDLLKHKVRALKRYHPEDTVKAVHEKRDRLARQLRREMKKLYVDKQTAFRQTVSKMNVLSPLNVMERGFSLTYAEDRTLIKSVDQTQPGDLVNVRLKDGTLGCQVWGIEKGEGEDDE